MLLQTVEEGKEEMKKSFTLIELVLVIAIVTVLAAAMVPIIRSSIEDAKVVKMIHLIDTLKDACIRYYTDVGLYGCEYYSSPFPGGHTLTINPGFPNWNGPYIRPFNEGDNPYGITVSVYSNAAIFDLDGDGIWETAGIQNWCRFTGVPESAAEKINDKYDRTIPGEKKDTGRVRYGGIPINFRVHLFIKY